MIIPCRQWAKLHLHHNHNLHSDPIPYPVDNYTIMKSMGKQDNLAHFMHRLASAKDMELQQQSPIRVYLAIVKYTNNRMTCRLDHCNCHLRGAEYDRHYLISGVKSDLSASDGNSQVLSHILRRR